MRKLLVPVIALAAGLLLVPPAQALNMACTSDGNCHGHAEFAKNGDHLYAEDTFADGFGVYVHYYRYDIGTAGEFTNRKGARTRVDHDMNLREGSKIEFEVCLLDRYNTTFDCSPTETTTA
ncbi:hypothetical protein [Saccharopolyspora sp. NPDC002578]